MSSNPRITFKTNPYLMINSHLQIHGFKYRCFTHSEICHHNLKHQDRISLSLLYDTSAQEVTVLCSSSFKFMKRHFGTSVLFSQLAVSPLSPSTVGIFGSSGPKAIWGPSTVSFSMETWNLIIVSRRISVNKYQMVITSIPVTERGRSREERAKT